MRKNILRNTFFVLSLLLISGLWGGGAHADEYVWYACSYVDVEECDERRIIRGHWKGEGQVGGAQEQRLLREQETACNEICGESRFSECQYGPYPGANCQEDHDPLEFLFNIERQWYPDNPVLAAQLRGTQCLFDSQRAQLACNDNDPAAADAASDACLESIPACAGGNLADPACVNPFNECLEAALAAQDQAGAPQQRQEVLPTRDIPDGYSGPIPECAFSYKGCRDVNELLKLVINVGQMIFSIIGSLAFLMFIFGGFTMVTAGGSSERFKKGIGVVLAAVIGLFISLSAYILIDLLLEALNVSDDFRGIR